MIPWERMRRFLYGTEATAPRPKWAETNKETTHIPQPGAPKPSVLLKLRGFVGVFLVINVCIGGYLVAKATPKTNKKQRGSKKEAAAVEVKKAVPEATQLKPVSHRKVTSNEQRQLFQWMLDEKRKLKPSNSTEKARIDEDKKVLKEFLRSKNMPTL